MSDAQVADAPAGTAPAPAPVAQAEKQFTQAEVDRLQGERAARATEAANKKWLESLGVKDQAEATAALVEYRKGRAAAQTDLEKAQERVKELETREADLVKRHTAQVIGTAIERSAAKMNFEHPELAIKLIEMQGVTVDKDDQVTGVDEALKKLAKDYPALIKTVDPVEIDATRRGRRGAESGELEAERKLELQRRFRINA